LAPDELNENSIDTNQLEKRKLREWKGNQAPQVFTSRCLYDWTM